MNGIASAYSFHEGIGETELSSQHLSLLSQPCKCIDYNGTVPDLHHCVGA